MYNIAENSKISLGMLLTLHKDSRTLVPNPLHAIRCKRSARRIRKQNTDSRAVSRL